MTVKKEIENIFIWIPKNLYPPILNQTETDSFRHQNVSIVHNRNNLQRAQIYSMIHK